MFGKVYPLLQELDPFLDEVTWKTIFSYQWEQEEDYCGYGLFEGEEIVGFLGLIFSKRVINHKTEHFCNLTSWVVKEQYRGHSLSMMLPIVKLKKYTLTDFSSYKEVIQISKRLGFRELDLKLKLVLPSSIFLGSSARSHIQVIQDSDLLKPLLKDHDLKLFSDHQAYPSCKHLLVCSGNQYCYLIFTLVKNSVFSYCYIQYISDVRVFSEYSAAIRSQIAKSNRTGLILVDSRLIEQVQLPFTYDVPLNFTKLYKSDSLRPEQIDNLYSELILLNLDILPKSWKEVYQKLRDRFAV
jgi:hypothetical protein